MRTAWREQIAEGVRELGLALGPEHEERLLRHLRLLEIASATLNLTSVSPADYAVLHVLDSLSAAPLLAAAPEGTFADLGSGAGFPGIPLAVESARPVDLIESTRKKARFLESVVAELCLKATVRDVRAEEAAILFGATYSAIVARAVTALPSLVELAAPLLSPRGHLLCLKGDLSSEERKRGRTAAKMLGLIESGCNTVRVPGLEARRTIVVYERTEEPSVRVPRRPGMAQRHPLA